MPSRQAFFGPQVRARGPGPRCGPQGPGPHEDRPIPLSGEPAARYNHREGKDDYTQAGNLYRKFDEGAKQRLAENIAGSLGQTPEYIQKLQLSHFYKADPDYGARVERLLHENKNQHPEYAHEPNEAEAAVHVPEK